MKAARTMLHSKKMPKTFWAEAVNTAVFVLNRTGSSPISGVSPFKLWLQEECKHGRFQDFWIKNGNTHTKGEEIEAGRQE